MAGRLPSAWPASAPAVFLGYDGTPTLIVDRPEDAIISESMREAGARTGEAHDRLRDQRP
jgi:hypothetical protein